MLCGNERGSVIRLTGPVAGCTLRSLSLDPTFRYSSQNAALTRVVVAQQGNVQFLHSVGGLVYVYVFGDRMGTVGLSGIGFPCGCGEDARDGLELMYKWYREHRVGRRKDPIRVTIGDQSIDGFLVDGTFDKADPATGLSQWNLQLAGLPDDD